MFGSDRAWEDGNDEPEGQLFMGDSLLVDMEYGSWTADMFHKFCDILKCNKTKQNQRKERQWFYTMTQL